MSNEEQEVTRIRSYLEELMAEPELYEQLVGVAVLRDEGDEDAALRAAEVLTAQLQARSTPEMAPFFDEGFPDWLLRIANDIVDSHRAQD